MRRMVWLGTAAVLVGGAAFALWPDNGQHDSPASDEPAAVMSMSPVMTPQFVERAERVEADEPIVVERPLEPVFTAFPLFDAVPGIVQSNGHAQPPRPDQEAAPRMPEVAD